MWTSSGGLTSWWLSQRLFPPVKLFRWWLKRRRSNSRPVVLGILCGICSISSTVTASTTKCRRTSISPLWLKGGVTTTSSVHRYFVGDFWTFNQKAANQKDNIRSSFTFAWVFLLIKLKFNFVCVQHKVICSVRISFTCFMLESFTANFCLAPYKKVHGSFRRIFFLFFSKYQFGIENLSKFHNLALLKIWVRRPLQKEVFPSPTPKS